MNKYYFLCIIISVALVLLANTVLYSQNKADSDLSKPDANGMKEQIIDSLNNVSAKFKISNIDTSFQLALKALTLSQEIFYTKGEMTSYINLGNVYLTKGEYTQAIESFLKALAIIPEGENTNEKGTVLNNIGSTYYRKNDYKKAIEYYRQAAKIFTALNDTLNLGKTNLNIGNIELGLKNYNEAILSTSTALQLFINQQYIQGQISAYTNLGAIYNELGNYTQAIENLTKALDIGYAINNQYVIAAVAVNLGYSYWKTNRNTEAKKQLLQSLEISKQLGILDIQREASGHLSDYYASQSDYKSALAMQILFKQISDSITNLSNVKKLTELELTYTFQKEQKEKELMQLAKESNEQQERKILIVILISVVGALLTVILLAYFIYRSRQKQSKINKQLQEANDEINQQKEVLALINKQLTDSINYARRIQDAVLPQKKYFDTLGFDSFILYLPRDIVSGDFYWIKKINNVLVITVSDCTGHGVPGAFMSMLGISLLNELSNNKEITKTSDALEVLRNQIKYSLHQSWENPSRDGMDMALFTIDLNTNVLQFSGANNNLYIVRNNELIELRGTRNPIGIHLKEKPFEMTEIELQSDDMLYLMTDGLIHQTASDTNDKYKISRAKALFLNVASLSCNKQYQIISDEVNQWKGSNDQIDDILLFGMRYSIYKTNSV